MKKLLDTLTHWNPVTALLLGGVLGALLIGYLSSDGVTIHDRLVTVTYTNDGYSPEQVFITRGSTVRFENKSDIDFWPASNTHPEHDLYPEFDPKESLPPGSAWEFTFEKTGPWHFHDHLKAHNFGIVYVLDGRTSDIDDLCSDTETEYENYCMHDYLYKIVETKGPTAAMDTIRDLYSRNQLGMECHKTTHDIGHATYAIHGTDFPFTESLILCTAGFFHGMMEGLVSDSNDPGAAVAWCDAATEHYESIYKDFEARCAHGVGHGIGESMLTEFDNDWQRFKEVTEEAAERCGIYDEVELNRVVCESGVYSVVVDWIIATEQEEHYFNMKAPYAFCATLKNPSMTQECIWEFGQRTYLYHESYADLFRNLAHYLKVSGLYDEYAVWAARAIGQQLRTVGAFSGTNEELVEICRVEDEKIEEGCLTGTIEGFITNGIWKEEHTKIEAYCRNDELTDKEEAWCFQQMNHLLSKLR